MVSQFSDVDGTDPDRLRASLLRSSSAALYNPYRERLHALVSETEGVVCDVGAGVGALVDSIGQSRPVVGVEPSQELTSTALSLGRTVVLGTGTAIPLPSSSVGCVTLERVLQHVDDVDAVLVECRRVLQPGGVLIAVDPVHSGVVLPVPQRLGALSVRVCAWRAVAGVATPDAGDRTAVWARASGAEVGVEVFVCRSGDYAQARVLTNFPEWDQLAREDGVPLGESEVREWEEFFAQPPGPGEFELVRPVQLTVVRW